MTASYILLAAQHVSENVHNEHIANDFNVFGLVKFTDNVTTKSRHSNGPLYEHARLFDSHEILFECQVWELQNPGRVFCVPIFGYRAYCPNFFIHLTRSRALDSEIVWRLCVVIRGVDEFKEVRGNLMEIENPNACRNFLKLCKVKYYNWNLFHTVQSNFIAQTGDPTGTGKGGESIYGRLLGEEARYYEAEQMPRIKHDKVGLLSMVNCGNNMLGSQFFITLDRDLQSLDGEHCVFGEIAEGLEVILKFNEAICDHDHRPYQDIRISHTVILEDPYDDPKTLVIPDRSPEPTREALMSDRIGADEAIDDTAGLSMEQITEIQKEKEAKARATILEIVGDIPDAEMAPPENVLFVCKLNPVTNDDDLEIIFSRFGRIVGCEVIRDRKTGDSLQYAFIEFADRKSCEEAYFKMDNVLIDDRRIHVDFSQSVSKMRWRGKGKGIMYNEDKDKGEKKSKPDAFESRGGRDRRKNSNDHRDSKSEARTNDKNREERPKSLKHDKRRAEKYRRENDDERYDKRRDNNERNNDRRRDRAKDKSNRTEMRSRRESRSRSGERRYDEKPFDRRGKRQDDDKRRDYLDGRSEKNDRVRQGDKRPREHSEERYRRKKDYRHDKYK